MERTEADLSASRTKALAPHILLAQPRRRPNVSLAPQVASDLPPTRLFAALGAAIGSLGEPAVRIATTALFTFAFLLCTRLASKGRRRHRHTKSLGFDPDYYPAVERRLSTQGGRPQLLIHQPTEHPEYSGWCAYANEQDLGSRDLVTWSVEDLVDHAPEAALPLRQGHGKWRWDDAQHAYQPI